MPRLLVVAKTALWLSAAALCFVSTLIVWRVGNHLDRTLASVDATMDQINRPCGAKDAQGKLLAPGTLCSLGKMVTHFGDLTVTAQKQVGQTDVLIEGATAALTSASGSLRSTSLAVNAQLADVGPVLDSLKASSDAIPPAVTSITSALLDKNAGLPPLLANGNGAVTDMREFLKQRAIQQLVDNGVAISGNFASMTTDANTKFHALLYPPPCSGWRCRIAETFNDVRLGSQFIEPAFYLRELLTGESISGTVTVIQKPSTSVQ